MQSSCTFHSQEPEEDIRSMIRTLFYYQQTEVNCVARSWCIMSHLPCWTEEFDLLVKFGKIQYEQKGIYFNPFFFFLIFNMNTRHIVGPERIRISQKQAEMQKVLQSVESLKLSPYNHSESHLAFHGRIAQKSISKVCSIFLNTFSSL